LPAAPVVAAQSTVKVPVLPVVHLVPATSFVNPGLSALGARKLGAPLAGVASAGNAFTVSIVGATSAADYVKIVSPAGGGGDRSSESSGPRRMMPPHGPLVPPADPSTPRSSFGSTSTGSWGGTGFVVAALVGLLVLVLSNFTSRIALLVEAPLAYRRALSLECPG
jgi:hypothetical protein